MGSVTDFLLELRSEEIPARMQVKAKEDLARLFAQEIAKAGLAASAVETFASPRRLALVARGLPEQTSPVSEERKGPRSNAPEQAVAGFLRSTGLTRTQLVERDGLFFAVIDKPGRLTSSVLAEAVPAVVRAFPWPKSMRWGMRSHSTESLRWVRPLLGIVALFGDDVVPFAVDGIVSGAATMGHRFHHSGPITIGSAGDYVEKLRACHVIVHLSERAGLIRDGARVAAAAAGLLLVEDEGLVVENAGLTEWPVPLLGRFDPTFLDVPREVIQLTMRTNQKYFACTEESGELANAFVCTANITASDDGAAIVAGNRKVLAARLSDAKFFWEHDLKVPLAMQAEKLSQIVFHERLGTVADKVERVAKLARWLCEKGVVSGNVDFVAEAAQLCKADLVTGMVGEFPELQGIIGGHLARAQGLDDAVADAIRDHYKPIGQGDDIPTAPVTVAVSLADKLDSLAQFFKIDEGPTGSRDPFALRRAALGLIALIVGNNLRLSLSKMIAEAIDLDAQAVGSSALANQILSFLADRLKVQQREAGVRHDLIDAVFALGREDDLLRLLARVNALQALMATADGANLLAGYKRVANILKHADATDLHADVPGAMEPSESALLAAVDQAERYASSCVQSEDFEGAMTALASLRAPIDTFFEAVMVNDPDPVKRAFRLGLLTRFRDAVHRVADFSRIEG
jgi:glycyl-tRNA synthetase beta chain